MNSRIVQLDEPGKLSRIIVPMMEREQFSYVLENGASGELVLGVGAQDDCAAFKVEGSQVLVAGSDYVRGPKFRLFEMGFLDYYDIGWYLAGANLSDVAAMGAVPVGVLSIIRYPTDLADSQFAEIVAGIRDSCAAVGAKNVGGDIGSAERIILSASAFGMVEPGNLLRRSGACPGQVVCLSAPTGAAGAALKIAGSTRHNELPSGDLDELLESWRRVRPRVQHGRIFARNPGVTSCIDTSDGLKAALETLADVSGVSIMVDEAKIPVPEKVRRVAKLLSCSALDLVFGDSVDFELVATADPASVPALTEECEASGLDLLVVGAVTEGSGVYLDRNDGVAPVPGAAWRHQV